MHAEEAGLPGGQPAGTTTQGGGAGTIDPVAEQKRVEAMLKLALKIGRRVAKKLVSADEAEDYASVVAMTLYERTQKEPGYRPENLATYVTVAVKNRFLNARRGTKRHTKRAEKFQASLEEENLDREVGQMGDGEREVVRIGESEREKLAQRVLNAMPKRCGEVFLLVKRDGMSYEEVAAALGISKKTIGRHMCNAYEVIEKTLAAAAAEKRPKGD